MWIIWNSSLIMFKIFKAAVFLKCRLLQYFGGILRVKYIRFKGQAAATEVKD